MGLDAAGPLLGLFSGMVTEILYALIIPLSRTIRRLPHWSDRILPGSDLQGEMFGELPESPHPRHAAGDNPALP